MQTRAQKWSANAYRCVKSMKTPTEKGTSSDKYKTSCMKMPGLIHQSGLLQSLVFQVARDESGRLFVDHLAETWREAQSTPQTPKGSNPTKWAHQQLIEYAQSQELKSYLALSREVAEIAHWFRRFAQIELADIEPSDNE